MGKALQVVVGVVIAAGFVVWKHTREPGQAAHERMHRSMVHGCQDSPAGRSLDADTGKRFCDCTIDRLVADHGYDKIDQAMDADPARQPAWLQDAMLSSARQCAASMDLDLQIQGR